MSDGNSKKRIIPPFVPSNPDQPIFQLQLLADGQYAMHAPGLSNPQILQILFGAVTQMMVITFQERDRPMIAMPPMGMQVPKDG